MTTSTLTDKQRFMAAVEATRNAGYEIKLGMKKADVKELKEECAYERDHRRKFDGSGRAKHLTTTFVVHHVRGYYPADCSWQCINWVEELTTNMEAQGFHVKVERTAMWSEVKVIVHLREIDA